MDSFQCRVSHKGKINKSESKLGQKCDNTKEESKNKSERKDETQEITKAIYHIVLLDLKKKSRELYEFRKHV